MMEELYTSIISSVISALGVGAMLKFFLGRLIKGYDETLKAIDKDLQEIKIKMAVHESNALSISSTKQQLEEMKRDQILMQSQIQAAWRELDARRRDAT